MRFLFLLFVALPIAEIYLLMHIGSRIGAANTVAIVFITALIGITLLRKQGMQTLLRANQRLEQGEIPIQEVVSGVILAVGGALFLAPGFITDSIGFFCLLPWTRAYLVKTLLRKGVVTNQGFGGFAYRSSGFAQTTQSGVFEKPLNKQVKPSPTVIDGEYRRED